MGNLQETGWLVISRRDRVADTGWLKVRWSVNRPALARNQVAVKMRLAVPTSAFTYPALAVELTVPEQSVVQPTVEVEPAEPDAADEPAQSTAIDAQRAAD